MLRSRFMRNEGAATLIREQPGSSVMIACLDDIVATAERIITSGIEQIALVSIHLCFAKEVTFSAHLTRRADNTTRYLLHDLRARVRKTDSVFQVGYALYFLL